MRPPMRNRRREAPPSAALDPLAAADAANLRHVADDVPGVTRHKARHGFDYRDPQGRLIGDEATLRRIQSLVIPPAWTDVWICPQPQGHLQATGRDQRGRKQYRYHPRWRRVRDAAKFEKMLVFGRVLPRIRARVEADLRREGLVRERVLAAIVRLLEATLFRIGNTEYAKDNNSFGLTTLRDRHVDVAGRHIHLSFRGKGGKLYESDIAGRRVARIVKDCRELPGYELFQFVDDSGARHAIGSGDVNEYLREASGEEITAKDFRTWAATNLAALALAEFGQLDKEALRKSAILRSIEKVAKHLGNTPTICRRCYIHPAIFDGYLDGSLLETLQAKARQQTASEGMSAEEAALVLFLRRRLGELAEEEDEEEASRNGRNGPVDACKKA